MTDRQKILDKIAKCLALSASSNEHEAAAALRQARKLMEAHKLSELDVQAAQAEEARARAGVTARPTAWESMLAVLVANTFGCKVIFFGAYSARRGDWRYIGMGAAAEVARYAFTVLLRQIKAARAEYIKTRLSRCKLGTKTRRADLFCDGWVAAVSAKAGALANREEPHPAITAFMRLNYPETELLKPTDRQQGKQLTERDWNDFGSGHQSGRSAILNPAVGGAASPALPGI